MFIQENREIIEQLDHYYFAYGFVSNVFKCRLRKSNRMVSACFYLNFPRTFAN